MRSLTVHHDQDSCTDVNIRLSVCVFRWPGSLWFVVVMIMRRHCTRGWRPIINRQSPWWNTIVHVVYTVPSMLLSPPTSSLPPSLLPFQPPPVKTLCYSSKRFLHPSFSLVSISFMERFGFCLEGKCCTWVCEFASLMLSGSMLLLPLCPWKHDKLWQLSVFSYITHHGTHGFYVSALLSA